MTRAEALAKAIAALSHAERAGGTDAPKAWAMIAEGYIKLARELRLGRNG